MPIPNLIHPVPITIQQLDKASTVQDHNHREPVQQSVRNADVIAPGQVMWFGLEMEVDLGGRKVQARGYVLFRYIDLNALSISLKYNDRITKMGIEDVGMYIVGLTPVGHYPDQSGATMVKAFVNDRQPAKGGFDY